LQKYSTGKWFVKKSMTCRAMPGKRLLTEYFPGIGHLSLEKKKPPPENKFSARAYKRINYLRKHFTY
jgi:hypothetical protein